MSQIDLLHTQEERVRKFMNRMQLDAMMVSAHHEYIVASRGTGKSEGLDARFILRNVWAMPGSMGGLISPTYAKAWGNTLPAIGHALASWGYLENVHYYVGRKAPASAGFKLPKRPPFREAWSNCIHFWNGTILVVLSLTNGMSANSMSLDWVLGPEAKFLNYDKIKTEINPANRGNLDHFGDCTWHHSEMYTTDMPTSRSGKWILDKEKEMQPDHIDLIRNIYVAKKQHEARKAEYVNQGWWQQRLHQYEADLSLARKYQPSLEKNRTRDYTTFYGEYDVFDNLEVVGEDFIWQMKRDLPPLVFRTSMLNERLFKVANGFYSALDDKIHFYIAPDPKDYCSDDFKGTKKPFGCQSDGDYDESLPLHIAFDSNAAISTCCVGQVHEKDKEFPTIKSFYVKTPRKLDAVVQDFCDYYSKSSNKEVIFYYDHTFVWVTGNNSESYSDTIIRVLESNGYSVNAVYIGQAPRHDWKHNQIDMALKGSPNLLLPTFNEMNNEYLKLAMERTGIKVGRNGFEKDKSDERLPDSPENPDETKTHVTDAWDTLFLGVNFFWDGLSLGSCDTWAGMAR